MLSGNLMVMMIFFPEGIQPLIIQKIIKRISKEMSIKEDEVEKMIIHFFSWQRDNMININYKGYLWNYFGKINIIEKRQTKKLEKENEQKEQT